MPAKNYLVYGLLDTREDHLGDVKYVGKSSYGLSRPKAHSYPSSLKKKTRVANWVIALRNAGKKPEIIVLESIEKKEDLNAAEIFWIELMRLAGANLCNHTKGGDGGGLGRKKGVKLSEKTKENMRQAHLGKKHTLDSILKIKAAGEKRGKPVFKEGNIKECATCGEIKNEEDFGFRKSLSLGLIRKNTVCKACRYAYERSWSKKNKERSKQHKKNNREKRIKILKKILCDAKNKPCVDCGIRYEQYVLDFDHVTKDKKISISKMVNLAYNVDVFLSEMAKCELVCSNCHRVRTQKRRSPIKSTPCGVRAEIIKIKEQSPCTDCAKFYPYYVMDFIHRQDEVKLGSIGHKMPLSLQVEETKKCDLVCSNCSRMRTFSKRPKHARPIKF